MDLNIIFQKIKEKMATDDKAFVLIVFCFFIVALAKVFFGFVPWYFLIVMMPMFFASLLHPKAGLFGLIFLTVLFERFFTLEALQFGRDIVKLYPLDIVLFGVYGGALMKMISTKVHLTLDIIRVFFFLFLILVSVYLGASFVGFGSQDISVAVSTWKNYVFYGMLFFVMPLILEDESDVKRLVNYFLSAVIVGIIFLFIGIVRGEGLWTEFTPLSTGGIRLLAFPHAFYFSLAFLGLFVTETFWAKGRYRAFLWMMLAIFMFGILGSLMRHIWIGMFSALCFSYAFLLSTPLRQGAKRMFSIGLTFVLILFSLAFFLTLTFPTSTVGHFTYSLVETVSIRFSSIGSNTDTSISWRGSTWDSAFFTLSENPVFGLGFGVRIPIESGDYRDFVEIRNIHNSWLSLLVQMGILGFITFLSFFGVLVWRVWKAFSVFPFLSALRIALLTIVFYQSIVFFAQPYLETKLLGIFFWFTLGLMYTLLSLVKKNSVGTRKL